MAFEVVVPTRRTAPANQPEENPSSNRKRVSSLLQRDDTLDADDLFEGFGYRPV